MIAESGGVSHARETEDTLVQPARGSSLMTDGIGAAARQISTAGSALAAARTFLATGDLDKALRLWPLIRDAGSAAVAVCSDLAAALQAAGRSHDADLLLTDGAERHMHAPDLAFRWAALPGTVDEFGTSAQRWKALIERFPSDPVPVLEASRALRADHRPEEAEALVAAGLSRFVEHGELVKEYVMVAHDRGVWREAAERCVMARRVAPDSPDGWVFGVIASWHLGDLAAAEEIALSGTLLFPTDRNLAYGLAETAVRRGDWPSALKRWVAARRKFPLDRDIQAKLHESHMLAAEDPALVEEVAGYEFATADDRRMHGVMMACESLGGALSGCEFGAVQRAFGAEPLGLLRWTDFLPGDLASALEARFEGFSDEENLDIYVYGGTAHLEYGVRNRRFPCTMQTFIDANATPVDVATRAIARRMAYLQRKLIDDLTQGSKLLVYKITYDVLTEAELDRLHRAIRSYGPATLLYVRYADSMHPEGTVTLVRPGLMVGYIDHFRVTRDDRPLHVPVDAWARICDRAYGLWISGTAERPT